ncbi:MAG: cytochrome c nitrite reductase small subunit [Ignavibacteria bacterium]|nr:cytochrome c nitrite reductase small subunit [Ignavibacteria bacterium]
MEENLNSKSPNNKSFKLTYYILSGVLIGTISLIIYLSKFFSYFSDEPSACVNCHIMTPHYATWYHSSHRERATCNDCHIPHENFIESMWFKFNDGLRHATVFTFGTYPQVIRIKKTGENVVQKNCFRCHLNQVTPINSETKLFQNKFAESGKLCWSCHREVPHGRTLSQASTPFARVPQLGPALPKWLTNFFEKNSN